MAGLLYYMIMLLVIAVSAAFQKAVHLLPFDSITVADLVEIVKYLIP